MCTPGYGGDGGSRGGSSLGTEAIGAANASTGDDSNEYGDGTLMSRRALFLDRDGVINHEVGYLHRAEDVRFVQGIFSLCRTAASLGYRLIVVTNQAGIARGFYTEADFDALMVWIQAELRAQGVELDAVYHCPFHPEHGIGEYKREHEDRKPGTGMLRRGAREFDLDLRESVMVGDRCSDVAAANAAGLQQAFLIRGTELEQCGGQYIAVDELDEVERWLVERG
jgi:D-glycero-D-manno-heptose 1,7-bisphosphate phosphatase